jgi:CheY-like chemotaxis protein
MTADVMPEQVERCLAAGMNGHLGKPLSPGALLQAIAAWTAPVEAPTTELPLLPAPEAAAEAVTEAA